MRREGPPPPLFSRRSNTNPPSSLLSSSPLPLSLLLPSFLPSPLFWLLYNLSRSARGDAFRKILNENPVRSRSREERCSKFLKSLRDVEFCLKNSVLSTILSRESEEYNKWEKQYHGSIRESNKLIADRRGEERREIGCRFVANRGSVAGHEKIVESNIRRAFTVRFPNLYCVWQRCRDIRGSYRNVLLLIVPPPWRWLDIREGRGGVCTQSERERGREWAVVKKEGRGPCARRGGGGCLVWRPGKRGKERKGARKGVGQEGEREKERKRRKRRRWNEEREKRSGNTACTGAFDRPMN